MKGILLSIPLLAVALSTFSGCDSGRNRTVTGDYFNREAGKSEASTVKVDSLRNYPSHFNSVSNAMVGKYGDARAFTVVKFTRPSSTTLANLESGRLKIIVSGVWSGGTREFGLYPARVDWADSTTLDPGVYLNNLGAPLAVNVDSTETITSMIFELNSAGLDYIKNWDSTGAFLLKNTDRGNSMMNIYTHYSNSQPILELVAHTIEGADTTRAYPIDSAYAYENGLGGAGYSETGILSDGGSSGFVLHVSLPDSFPRTNAFNNAKMTIPISRNQIPSDGNMNVGAYLLTAPFTTSSAAKVSSSYYTEYTIKPTDTKIDLNITGMLGVWAGNPAANYGILIKPIKVASTPAQISLTPPDSVSILYTTLPEVE